MDWLQSLHLLIESRSAMYLTMSCTSLIAPFPTSPHIIFLLTGPSISYPQPLNISIWCPVIGCYHIKLFMEGHAIIGLINVVPFYSFCIGQALQTKVIRLSHIPLDSLARVLAPSGAISITSAHFLSYICRTGSPRFPHISHYLLS